MTVQLSRRNILKSTALAAAGFIPAAAAIAQTTKIPSQWDETTDIIIVGSGFAGLFSCRRRQQRRCQGNYS